MTTCISGQSTYLTSKRIIERRRVNLTQLQIYIVDQITRLLVLIAGVWNETRDIFESLNTSPAPQLRFISTEIYNRNSEPAGARSPMRSSTQSNYRFINMPYLLENVLEISLSTPCLLTSNLHEKSDYYPRCGETNPYRSSRKW